MLWITGAKGLLGSALCERAQNYIATGKELDIGDKDAVLEFVRKHPLDRIINCAAYSLVDQAESEREEAFRVNAQGPKNLAIAANEIKAQFIHLSTDYVFQGDGSEMLSEEEKPAPCNYYGYSKLEGEKSVLEWGHTVVRTSWIFGRGGKNFVAKLFSMLQTQKHIRLASDQFGRVTYAPDLAEALLEMQGIKGLYHYANEGVVSRYEFALFMREQMIALGFSVTTETIEGCSACEFSSLCKRPKFSALDTKKIEQFIKIRHWKEAIREFLCAIHATC